ncbi:MBL fold metallo-hydrolase [Frateuria aurantia]
MTIGRGPTLEFVNHASVLVSNASLGLLTDPWYFGRVFHEGWSLLTETSDAEIKALLHRTDMIWISHEHPDHFSPPFLKRYAELIRQRGIRFLFQTTRDQRVAGFLRAQGFAVQELEEGGVATLAPGFSARVVKDDLYDSALLLEVDGLRVFNLNDCLLSTDEALADFRRRHGPCDILLTQFSYAAWKGGPGNMAWRQRAAQSKLEIMRRQIKHLQPSACIPFASYVRFGNVLNSYMNDAINRPAQVRAALADLATEVVVMRPGESQRLSGMRQDPASLQFWERQYAHAERQPLAEYVPMDGLKPLYEAFAQYQAWVFRENSRLLMRLGHRGLKLRPFGPTRVWLLDQEVAVEVDPLKGKFETTADEDIDLAIHSRSLEFIFRFPFGFDTLFVNGCFEERRPRGFERFAKCFVIGNLNAIGIHVGPLMIRHLGVLLLLLKKMRAVRRNTAQIT